MLHLANEFMTPLEFSFDGLPDTTFIKGGNRDMFIHELTLGIKGGDFVDAFFIRDKEISFGQIMKEISDAMSGTYTSFYGKTLKGLGTIYSGVLNRVIPVKSYSLYVEKKDNKL